MEKVQEPSNSDHLDVFDMCTIANTVHIKLVFQLHPYILHKMELSFYTNNLPDRTVSKLRKRMTWKVDSCQKNSPIASSHLF
jgi:hypothetical protein